MSRVSSIVLVILISAGWVAPLQAQEEAAKNAAAAAAVAYSQLEAWGDFDQLYDEMHPHAQAIIPREAVVGWYENEFAPLGPGIASVFNVIIVPWVWEVTGTMYPDTAVVAYRQPFADGSVVNGTVRLVQDEYGDWRWFFGQTREFVDQQIALYASPERVEPAVPTEAPLPETVQLDPFVVIQEAVAEEVGDQTEALEARLSQLEATVEAEVKRADALETRVAVLERELEEQGPSAPPPDSAAVTVSPSPSPTPTSTPVPETPTPTPTKEFSPTPTEVLSTATTQPVVVTPTSTPPGDSQRASYLDPRLLRQSRGIYRAIHLCERSSGCS